MTRHALKAIIYDKRGHILSIGENSYIKTHPIMFKYARTFKDPNQNKKTYIHAELSAILKCSNIKRAHRILVTRYHPDKGFILAKPCPVCMKAISEMTNIKIVEWTE